MNHKNDHKNHKNYRNHRNQDIVIFTDLDGTLLDPKTYEIGVGREALDELKRLGIPLVFVSSKTRFEIEGLRKRLGVIDPFISENGGAIFLPVQGWEKIPGAERVNELWCILVGERLEDFEFRLRSASDAAGVDIMGFSDMTVEEVSELTGLPVDQARLAQKREFAEPFVVTGFRVQGSGFRGHPEPLRYGEGRSEVTPSRFATGQGSPKSEIRNPKSETNPKSKIQNPKQTPNSLPAPQAPACPGTADRSRQAGQTHDTGSEINGEGLLRLQDEIEKRGMVFSRGGGFHHVMMGCDKGKAVSLLMSLYRNKSPHVKFAAIGDSLNDLPMLRIVDYPFLVRRPDGSYDESIVFEGIKITEGKGPAGFREAVYKIIHTNKQS